MISAEEIKALMAKDENGLLPCPSCRHRARILKREIGIRGRNNFDWWHSIQCAKCNLAVGYDDNRYRDKNDAIAAWNTRTYTPAVSTLQTLLNQAAFYLRYIQRGSSDDQADFEQGHTLTYYEINNATEKALAAIEPYISLSSNDVDK